MRISYIVLGLALALLIVFMIPITAMVIDPSDPDPLNTPIYELDGMSLNDVFDIDSTSTFTDINDLSMTDIFETGNIILNSNFTDNITNWTSSFSSSVWNSGIIQNTGDGSAIDPSIRQSGVPYINGNSFYTITKFRVTNNLCSVVKVYIHGALIVLQEPPIMNTWYEISTLSTSVADTTYRLYHQYLNTTDANGAVLEVDYTRSYNLNSLGISTLSKIEMDLLYNLYKVNSYEYDYDTWNILYSSLSLTETQFDYYHDLYVYYTSL